MSFKTLETERLLRKGSKVLHDKAVKADEREAEQRMEVATTTRKEKTGAIVDKLADGKKLSIPDLNYLATPAVRLEYMRVLRDRGHDPGKFADMFDVLHEIASNDKVTPANRLKAANAYISRTREMYNLAGEADPNIGVQNVLIVEGDLIAGGQRNQDPVQPVREAEVPD